MFKAALTLTAFLLATSAPAAAQEIDIAAEIASTKAWLLTHPAKPDSVQQEAAIAEAAEQDGRRVWWIEFAVSATVSGAAAAGTMFVCVVPVVTLPGGWAVAIATGAVCGAGASMLADHLTHRIVESLGLPLHEDALEAGTQVGWIAATLGGAAVTLRVLPAMVNRLDSTRLKPLLDRLRAAINDDAKAYADAARREARQIADANPRAIDPSNLRGNVPDIQIDHRLPVVGGWKLGLPTWMVNATANLRAIPGWLNQSLGAKGYVSASGN